MTRSAVVVTVVLLTCNVSASAQQLLNVHNGMSEGVYVWIKSETRPEKDWQRWFVARNCTKPVRLNSPDRFQVVVEDQQHRQFSVGLLPLKRMIGENPSGVLDLGGVFAAKMATSTEWSPSLRSWVIRQTETSERIGVTYTLRAGRVQYERITAYQTN
jgi:hypothetical protein